MMPSPEGKRKTDVNVLYESELDRFLDHLGVRQEFYAGKLKCFHTHVPVTVENLFGFFKYQGQVLAISTDEKAVEMAYQLQRQEDAYRGAS